MGCFSGRLMSAASDQKSFCKLCSPFCCSFDEFVEEKCHNWFLMLLSEIKNVFKNDKPKTNPQQVSLLEKTLESPLDYKEIKPVNPKGNQY